MTKEASKASAKNIKDVRGQLDKSKAKLKRPKKRKVTPPEQLVSSYTIELEPGETLGQMFDGLDRRKVKDGRTG